MKIALAAVVLGRSLAPVFSLSCMDSLNTGASNPSGAGIASYLDALTSGGNTISGAGISSYTDALSGSRTAPRAATTPAPVSAAPVAPAAIAPVAATPLAGSGAALAGSSSSYLQALGTGANLSGGGIPTYKDALPSSNVVAGGSGIATHKDNLPSVNVVSGAGLTSYTPQWRWSLYPKAIIRTFWCCQAFFYRQDAILLGNCYLST